MRTWKFGIDNDRLVELVLNGKKRATTSLYSEEDVPIIDEESALTFSDGSIACITKTSRVVITEFISITWDLAKLEGENNSIDEWKEEHINFFKSIDNNFNENAKVVFEVFEVVL